MMPCMAGCAGPIPMCMFWGPPPVPAPSPSMNSRVVVLPTSGMAPSGLRSDQRLAPVDRVILAKGVTHELLVHEQPAQIGMVLEAHPEHVPHLALEPVRDRPEGDGGRNGGVILIDSHLQTEAMIVGKRVEVVDELEAWS